MKIVISAGGRFHAINLAHQLQKHNYLHSLFSFSYTKLDKKLICKKFVYPINSCKFFDYTFQKLKLSHFINPSIFNSYKDNLFDFIVSKKINKIGQFDLFIGWAHYSLKTLTKVKRLGAKSIIESGSCHILEQQNILLEEYKKWGIKFNPIYKPVIDKMLGEYEKTDYIMTLSDFSYKSFVKQGINSHKLLKVPCGINVSFFYDTDHNNKTEIFDKFRVIFVGLISLRKGIPYLIDSWNKLNLPEKTTELALVGSIQKDIYQLLKKLKLKNNIKFLGPLDTKKLKDLYKKSHLFVLPSVEDGFGMVVGEAMASGLPVICTENSGISEILQDSINGFTIPVQNSDLLAEKILWCYKNQKQAQQIGLQGKQTVLKYSWDNYGKKIIEAYQKVLNS